MLLGTDQCKLSWESVYLVNFFSGINGLKLLQVFQV